MTDGWLARIVVARAIHTARLLLVALAVAVVSCASLASLALMASATERAGLRTALGEAADESTRIVVAITLPTVTVTRAQTSTRAAIASVVDDSVPVDATTFAQSGFAPLTGIDDAGSVQFYLGQVDGIEASATIVEGTWPTKSQAGSRAGVAVPEAAADALGWAVGDSVMSGGSAMEVLGVYRVDDPTAGFWDVDQLGGLGFVREFVPQFSDASSGATTPTDSVGPLIVAPAGLDALAPGLGVSVASIDIRFQPDFSVVDVDAVEVLSDRLGDARSRVLSSVGAIGDRVSYSSRLGAVIDEAASGLLVTRSTVITVGLLLLVVAAAALAQVARLIGDARFDERRLLLARGASARIIRRMTAVEAVSIGLVAAVVAPLLAVVVYAALAAHPSMIAAGIPSRVGLPASVWLVSFGGALVFVGVLLAPLVRPVELVDDDSAERQAARPRRPLGAARWGIDAGVAVFALIVYSQLVAPRDPGGGSSARIDPILVAAPALLLVAGSVLAVRLVPVVAWALDRVAARARGAVMSLAAWELGRRADRATAVVLLLTLALGTGSFGATFLATWLQSQKDQAAFSVGPPVRVAAQSAAVPTAVLLEGLVLADGAIGSPQPVLRRLGEVTRAPSFSGAEVARGPEAQIMGLGETARRLIDRDRNSLEGGSAIARLLSGDPPDPPEVPEVRGVSLPPATAAVSALVRIGDAGSAFAGVSATVSAVVEGANGVLVGVPLGEVPVDGAAHPVRGTLIGEGERAGGVESEASPVDLVGFVVDFGVADRRAFVSRGGPTTSEVFIGDVEALPSQPDGGRGDSDDDGQPVSLESVAWIPHGAAADQPPPRQLEGTQGQLGLRVSIPENPDGVTGTFSLTGWDAQDVVPIVATADLLELMGVSRGAQLTVVVSGAQIPVRLVGTVARVPGSSSAPDSNGSGSNETGSGADLAIDASSVVVVDHQLMSRALLMAGAPDATADEWWVDVAPGAAAAYADLHPEESGRAIESSELIALERSEGPLRIATPMSLWVVIAGAGLVTVTGFAAHTAASLRSRRAELAQLRAIGFQRRSLVVVVGVESLVVSVLGTVFGLALGVFLGSVVTPLVGLSPDGGPLVPAVSVVIPFGILALLATLTSVAVLSVVLIVAGRQRAVDPARILREGDG